jgi:hypothetical protein
MYREATVDVGYLQEARIDAVFMPREDFLGVVQATLDNAIYEDYSPIADKVLKTAQTIERFPFGAWLHTTRGCGCLVGEMLVADEVIDEFNRRNQADIPIDDELALDIRRKLIPSSAQPMMNLLKERYPDKLAETLADFGDAIDEALAEYLDKTTPDWKADAIIIEDS